MRAYSAASQAACVPAPKPGDKIRVTGPWVTDLAHGRNEIHPAFKIEKID